MNFFKNHKEIVGILIAALLFFPFIPHLHKTLTEKKATRWATSIVKKKMVNPDSFDLDSGILVWKGRPTTPKGIVYYVVRLKYEAEDRFKEKLKMCSLVAFEVNREDDMYKWGEYAIGPCEIRSAFDQKMAALDAIKNLNFEKNIEEISE